MRTVIYARFSSDNQNPRSTADQIDLCRQRAEKEGWTVVATFEDAAISGAAGVGPDQRPGLHAMLALVESGGIDQVLAESTDRITRHVADAHTIRERIEFAGARLFTLFDGTVTPMIGLVKGFVDAQFRTDLAKRVRRGQVGNLAQGRSTSSIAYGYRQANRIDEKGNAVKGLRDIDPEKAEIVRRIFREYVAGRSPAKIAAQLNAEGIAGPRGGYWQTTTISGGKRHAPSILRREIYIGVLVYGITKSAVHPQTRRRLNRPADRDQIVRHDAPHLRIIDDELWNQAQARLEENAFHRPERMRRPKHLLSGLGVCGVCGGSWIKISSTNWGCGQYFRGQHCTNNRQCKTHTYERSVLADLKNGLLAPDVVSAYVREYHRDFARQAADLGRDRQRVATRLAEATRRMERMLKAFSEGGNEFDEIRDMLANARAEKERLASELANMDALPKVLALHPGIEDEYRRQIEELETALAQPEAQLEAIPRLRAMIARIVVLPSDKLRGVKIQVARQMDEVLGLATEGSFQIAG